MKRLFIILVAVLALTACKTIPTYKNYDEALANWTSHEDVADWLRARFVFSHKRLNEAKGGGVVRAPEGLYEIKKGYCVDAAYFGMNALNSINPEYEAGLVFIANKGGGNNHYVTGFKMDGKIYIMDYGAGSKWTAMHGVHGPYDSLDGYKRFLSYLSINNFRVGSVAWNAGYNFSED